MTELTFLDDVYVDLIKTDGNDDLILDAARVSTKKSFGFGAQADRDLYVNSRNDAVGWGASVDQVMEWQEEAVKKDKGLINMLTRDRHGSPFEHVGITVYVKAPIFVFREWHRHRIASYNEMSGRYTKLLPEFYIPKASRPLLQVGKPGAYTFEPGNEAQHLAVVENIKKNSADSWRRYEYLLGLDVAKEIARAVLPVNIYSRMYCTMNIRALTNFLSLRTQSPEHAIFSSFPQQEISYGADKLERIFADKFPWTHEAWDRNGRTAL